MSLTLNAYLWFEVCLHVCMCTDALRVYMQSGISSAVKTHHEGAVQQRVVPRAQQPKDYALVCMWLRLLPPQFIIV